MTTFAPAAAPSPRQRIVITSIGYSPEMLVAGPYLRSFDMRGMGEAVHAKRKGHRNTTIVVSADALPFALAECAYLSRFLPPGCASVPVKIVAPARPAKAVALAPSAGVAGPGSLCADVLADAHLIAAMAVGGPSKVKFFASGPAEAALMVALGPNATTVTPTPDTAERHGSKLGSKLAFDAAGVATPPGPRVVFTDMATLRLGVEALADAHPDAVRAVTKMNGATWAGGSGFERLDLRSVRAARGEAHPAWFTKLSEDLSPRIDQGVVLEVWLEGVTESPSGQASISADGTVKVRSSHRQILDEKLSYEGAIYPSGHHAPIADAMQRIGSYLASQGVRGSFGVDFVVVAADGIETVVANEINLRQTGAFHPLRLLRYVTGATRGADHLFHFEDGAVVHYKNERLHEASLKHLDLDGAVGALEGARLAYDPATQTGAILQITSAMPVGFVEITAVAHSAEHAAQIQAASRECLVRAARERQMCKEGAGGDPCATAGAA